MFSWIRKFGLNAKVALLGVGSVLVTAIALVALAVHQSNTYHQLAQSEADRLLEADVDHLTYGIYHLVANENEAAQQQDNINMNVARHVLTGAGGPGLSSETTIWTVVNQLTGRSIRTQLPKMLIGGQWLGNNADLAVETPVVDKVTQLTGATATIFQRMNEKGDMLRVATTVKDAQGRRALGTYIPAVNPDGVPNPVIAAVLKGEPYHGRAFVVNDWYLTAYEAI
jgi:hypothetical protein